MKDSGEETTKSATPRRENKKVIAVSARKIAANRQNALKSTGPKTIRGKVYSGRNAIKHGLFARQFMDFEALAEDPKEYQELLGGLLAHYQPVGTAEQLEVQRIALCWWKHERVWRYENAMNRVANRCRGRQERAEQAAYCKTQEKDEEAAILLLRDAKKEIELTGEISQELKQKIVAILPEFEFIWWRMERDVPECPTETAMLRIFQKLNPQQRSSFHAWRLVTEAIAVLQALARKREASVFEISVAQHVIPDDKALDKILRYGGGDRSTTQ